ncbi:heme exporter protein CcmB [Marinicellulosiphila megalodicopiae]|uniref:heme exporter protein CcmB n=1 Tax=Marinicellulosiphila megalodicopiae TaxID=2724896 RepID=UPI003BB20191
MTFKHTCSRELLLSSRRKGELFNPLVFFFTIMLLFPVAVSPDPELLAQIAPGVIWIAALLSLMLSLDGLFRDDFQDGFLEQMLISQDSLVISMFAKILCHWLVTGLPLILMSPVIAIMLSLPVSAIGVMMLGLLFGTIWFSFIGAIPAALTVGLRKGGLLLTILVLPMMIPLLSFGSLMIKQQINGEVFSATALLCAGLSLLAMMLAPFMAAVSLRISLSE